MDEILALQQKLQDVQMQDTSVRLSHSSVIDLVSKLIEKGQIELIYTTSGKEYVTPEYLRIEIADEIVAAGGRITIANLQSILGVDMTHIQNACTDVIRTKNFVMMYDEMLTPYYLDGIVEEINQQLEDVGQLPFSVITKRFDLGEEFLKRHIKKRMGTLFQGKIEGDYLYTDIYVHRHMSRIQGIFIGATVPTSLRKVVKNFQLISDLSYEQLKHLVNKEKLPGSINGSKGNCIYTPHVYSRAQEESVLSFYTANGYIEYSKLKALKISGPKSYLKKRFPKGIALKTCWLGETYVDNLIATLEETLTTNGWCEATPILPPPASEKDVEVILKHCIDTVNKENKDNIIQTADVFGVSSQLVESCKKKLLPFLTSLAAALPKEVQKKKQEATSVEVKKNVWSDDEEDTRSKGRKGKKGKKGKKKNVQEEIQMNPNSKEARKQARRLKAGGGKRDRGGINRTKKGKRKDDSDDENYTPKNTKKLDKKSKKSNQVGKKKTTQVQLSLVKIIEALKKLDECNNMPDELFQPIALFIRPSLLKTYKEIIEKIASGQLSNASNKRAELKRITTRIQHVYDYMCLYQSGITTMLELNDEIENVDGQSMRIKMCQLLDRHLRKTLCVDAVDLLLRTEAVHNDWKAPIDPSVSAAPQKQKKNNEPGFERLTKEERQSILKVCTSMKRPIQLLISTKSSEEFLEKFLLTTQESEMRLTQLNRKKEKGMSYNIRSELINQLKVEKDPLRVLQYTVLIIYSKVYSILHAPNSVISMIIPLLKGKMDHESFVLLSDYAKNALQYSDLIKVKNTANASGDPFNDSSLIDLNSYMMQSIENIRNMGLNFTRKK